ncbi:MAG: hypothetical protein ACOY5B_09065 [Spirochaetota bacterium]
MRIVSVILLLSVSIPPVVAQEKPAAPDKKIFSININPPPDTSATELEFSEIDLAKATPEQAAQARTNVIRTAEKTYREYVAPELRFFRVRSIHKTGVPGAFGKTLLVQDYLRKPYREPRLPLVQQGKTEYLLGSRIELPQQPGLVTRYRLDEGESLEYKEPLVFDKPGTYRMQVSIENDAKEAVLSRTYIFKVELNAPTTRAVISDPVHGKRGIKLGKDSALLFLATDAESGVAKTFYRLAPIGKNIEEVAFREYGKRLSFSEVSAGGAVNLLQFYSVDVAGNKEELRSEVIFCEAGPEAATATKDTSQ